MGDFVVLTDVANRSLGDMLVEVLKDNGIEAFVNSDDYGGVNPALNFVDGTRVMVSKDSLEQAQSLMKEFEASVDSGETE